MLNICSQENLKRYFKVFLVKFKFLFQAFLNPPCFPAGFFNLVNTRSVSLIMEQHLLLSKGENLINNLVIFDFKGITIYFLSF